MITTPFHFTTTLLSIQRRSFRFLPQSGHHTTGDKTAYTPSVLDSITFPVSSKRWDQVPIGRPLTYTIAVPQAHFGKLTASPTSITATASTADE